MDKKVKNLISKYVTRAEKGNRYNASAEPTRKTMRAWKRYEDRQKRKSYKVKTDDKYCIEMKTIVTSIMYCDPEACPALRHIGDDALMVYLTCMDDPKTRKEIYEVCKTCQEGFTNQINR